MRSYKFSLAVPLAITLAITLVMSLTVAIVYAARITIISAVLNHYLAPQQSELTCLDVTIDADFNIVISKLCMQAPLARLEINHAVIDWQPTTSMLLPELINAVNISAIKVQGTAVIPLNLKTSQSPISARLTSVNISENKPPFSDLPQQIKQLMAAIALLKIPVPVEVERISYQPFVSANSHEHRRYLARFSANATAVSLRVTTAEKVAVGSVKFLPEPEGFSAELEVDLGELTSFLVHHQLALSAQLSKDMAKQFSHAKSNKWSIDGQLHSQLTWHKETLTTSNQLHDFSFSSTTGLALAGGKIAPFTLAGDLQWQSDLSANTLQLNFDKKSIDKQNVDKKNQLTFDFNQPSLIALLRNENAPEPLVDLLTDNDVNQLEIFPHGNLTVDFAQAEVFIAQLELKASPPISLSLNDIALSYALKPGDAITAKAKPNSKQPINIRWQQTNFTLAAQLNIAAVQPFSTQPVIIAAAGVIKQNQDHWQIALAPNTQVTLSALSLISTTADTANVSAANLTLKVQGAVSIAKSIGIAQDISLNLQVNSELSRLQLADVMHLKRLQLTADISADADNISVKGLVVADNIAVAKIHVSGGLTQPKLEVLASEVQITDLLALNVNLPVEVKLIDGTLSYHLNGQLPDFTQPLDEPITNSLSNGMTLSISLQAISGEIAGIWLQDLNWQQTLRVEKGLITSVPQDKAQGKTPANKLSIALIEAAIPIENFSAQIQLNVKQQHLALVATNMGGEVLGGSFNIANAQWPFQGDRSVDVQLNSIDLEKLLELDQQQGIVVTGNISGHLPVYFDGQQWLIKAGELHNVSNGIIQVMNNAAVAQLKASSTELKLAFDALQNLHYHQLTSAVSMADDGYMNLATVIKGRNPDLDNEVNFNLNLNYDLLGLLESLDITQQLEQRIIKHTQQKIPQH